MSESSLVISINGISIIPVPLPKCWFAFTYRFLVLDIVFCFVVFFFRLFFLSIQRVWFFVERRFFWFCLGLGNEFDFLVYVSRDLGFFWRIHMIYIMNLVRLKKCALATTKLNLIGLFKTSVIVMACIQHHFEVYSRIESSIKMVNSNTLIGAICYFINEFDGSYPNLNNLENNVKWSQTLYSSQPEQSIDLNSRNL